jgi:L-fuconolactonase
VPEFPIIDTHVHLWDTDQLSYPWLADLPPLNRPHRLEAFREATAGVDVERFVFLQCGVDPAQYRQEAAWVTRLARDEPRIAAMVPFAPLEKGHGVRDELAELVQANPLTRGVRRLLQSEPDPAFCLRPDFVRGVQLLAEFDLHFELCLKGDEQMRHAVELVRRCPDVWFILDHIGKPRIAERVMEPWTDLIGELAALPNAWCKISGVVTEADVNAWAVDHIEPYIRRALDAFGPDRVVFGSDWPVVTLAASYKRWLEALDDIVSDLDSTTRRSLYHANAAAFYRL